MEEKEEGKVGEGEEGKKEREGEGERKGGEKNEVENHLFLRVI